MDVVDIDPSSFPAKLWRLVNNPEIKCIFWDRTGRVILIDQNTFEKQILSPGSSILTKEDSFKTTSFSSFVRQLNLYGFKKIRIPHESPQFQHYFHPNFQQKSPERVAALKRLTVDYKAKVQAALVMNSPPSYCPDSYNCDGSRNTNVKHSNVIPVPSTNIVGQSSISSGNPSSSFYNPPVAHNPSISNSTGLLLNQLNPMGSAVPAHATGPFLSHINHQGNCPVNTVWNNNQTTTANSMMLAPPTSCPLVNQERPEPLVNPSSVIPCSVQSGHCTTVNTQGEKSTPDHCAIVQATRAHIGTADNAASSSTFTDTGNVIPVPSTNIVGQSSISSGNPSSSFYNPPVAQNPSVSNSTGLPLNQLIPTGSAVPVHATGPFLSHINHQGNCPVNTVWNNNQTLTANSMMLAPPTSCPSVNPEMPDPLAKPSSIISGDRIMDVVDIDPSSFPAKLWRLVNNPEIKCIFWDRTGRVILIDQNMFEKQILSPGSNILTKEDTFGTTSFSSFVRQLNLYGFKDIRIPHESPQFQHYFHPNFQQKIPEHVAALTRLTADHTAKLQAAPAMNSHPSYCPDSYNCDDNRNTNVKRRRYTLNTQGNMIPVPSTNIVGQSSISSGNPSSSFYNPPVAQNPSVSNSTGLPLNQLNPMGSAVPAHATGPFLSHINHQGNCPVNTVWNNKQTLTANSMMLAPPTSCPSVNPEMPDPLANPSTSISGDRTVDVVDSDPSSFPAKLWRLVNNPEIKCIFWDRTGRVILIDQNTFEKQILSPGSNILTKKDSFRTTSYSSFVRQLNLYGFKKIRIPHESPQFQHYFHPNFQQKSPEHVAALKRLTVDYKAKLQAAPAMNSHPSYCPDSYNCDDNRNTNVKRRRYSLNTQGNMIPVPSTNIVGQSSISSGNPSSSFYNPPVAQNPSVSNSTGLPLNQLNPTGSAVPAHATGPFLSHINHQGNCPVNTVWNNNQTLTANSMMPAPPTSCPSVNPEMPDPLANPSSIISGDRTVDVVDIDPSSFPAKLWRLVNNPEIKCIFWDRTGRVILIDQNTFEKQILSPGSSMLTKEDTFGTTSFSSFVRQLNLYGFREVIIPHEYQQFRHYYLPNLKHKRPERVAALTRLAADHTANLQAAPAMNSHPSYCPDSNKCDDNRDTDVKRRRYTLNTQGEKSTADHFDTVQATRAHTGTAESASSSTTFTDTGNVISVPSTNKVGESSSSSGNPSVSNSTGLPLDQLNPMGSAVPAHATGPFVSHINHQENCPVNTVWNNNQTPATNSMMLAPPTSCPESPEPLAETSSNISCTTQSDESFSEGDSFAPEVEDEKDLAQRFRELVESLFPIPEELPEDAIL